MLSLVLVVLAKSFSILMRPSPELPVLPVLPADPQPLMCPAGANERWAHQRGANGVGPMHAVEAA